MELGEKEESIENRGDTEMGQGLGYGTTRLFGWLIAVIVSFVINSALGAVVLYVAVGGNGRIWFERNAYFYTQGAAVFNGVVWGVIMGGIYVALINLLHLSKGWMTFLLIWGFLGVGYSGFSAKARTREYMRDGAHTNLSIIQITSILLYLPISIISYLLYVS
jgi:hypothetical protein